MKSGYITVYLSLVTGILLSLLLTVMEGVRMHTIRTQTECVMDMAMDSALAEYHREMLEQYDLFFIDMSYGGRAPSFSNTEEHIRSYMNMNFRPFQIFNIPVGKDLTALTAQDVQLQQAAVASDEKGEVLKAQAVDYVGSLPIVSASPISCFVFSLTLAFKSSIRFFSLNQIATLKYPSYT